MYVEWEQKGFHRCHYENWIPRSFLKCLPYRNRLLILPNRKKGSHGARSEVSKLRCAMFIFCNGRRSVWRCCVCLCVVCYGVVLLGLSGWRNQNGRGEGRVGSFAPSEPRPVCPEESGQHPALVGCPFLSLPILSPAKSRLRTTPLLRVSNVASASKTHRVMVLIRTCL